MELIHVPAPSKDAFNKHRHLSDLIKAQIKHLKHVEHGLLQEIRDTLPQHPIVTENEAAVYIASMTALLHSRAVTPEAPAKLASRARQPSLIRPSSGISLAAAAGQTSGKSSSRKKTRLMVTQKSKKNRDGASSKRKK
jgi:hypothetical protein